MISSIVFLPTNSLTVNSLPTTYKPDLDEVVVALAATRPELEEAINATENETNENGEINEDKIFNKIKGDIGGIKINSKEDFTNLNKMADDEEELENFRIVEGDNMLVTCRSGEESYTDFCIYNTVDDELFTHHSNLLTAMPLGTAF